MKFIYDDPLLDALKDGRMSLGEWYRIVNLLITKYGAEIIMEIDSGGNNTSFRIIQQE
jgi:hypothetical protein